MAKHENTEESVDTSHVGESLQMESGFETFVETHLKKILLVGLAAAVAAGAWIFVKESSKGKNAEAAVAFTSAFTRADLEMVSTDHPGTIAAGNAILLIGERDLTVGNREDARIRFEEFVSKHPKHPRRSQAEFGLATIAEMEGDLKKAEQLFQNVVESGGELGPLAMIRVANIQAEGGDLEKSMATLDGVMERFVGNPFIDFIDERRQSIRRQITLAENPPPAFEWPEIEEPQEEPETDDGKASVPLSTIPVDPASLPEGTSSTSAIEIPSLSDLGSEDTVTSPSDPEMPADADIPSEPENGEGAAPSQDPPAGATEGDDKETP